MHLGTSGETFGTASSWSDSFSPLLSVTLILLHLDFFFSTIHPISSAFLILLLYNLISLCLNYCFLLFFSVITFSWFLSPSFSRHLFLSPALLLLFSLHYSISLFLTTPTLANPFHRLSETFLGIVNKCLEHCADMSWC